MPAAPPRPRPAPAPARAERPAPRSGARAAPGPTEMGCRRQVPRAWRAPPPTRPAPPRRRPAPRTARRAVRRHLGQRVRARIGYTSSAAKVSAVGETRQLDRRSAWRAAWAPARLLHFVLRPLLVLAVLLLGAGSLLAWRLSQGPLDVAWLARRIEAAAFPEGSPTRLQIGRASIAWQGWDQGADRGLELRLRDLRVVNGSGAPGARLDEAEITLSLGRLLELRVAPRSIALAGLRLRALRA